jgi:hypothetical protein
MCRNQNFFLLNKMAIKKIAHVTAMNRLPHGNGRALRQIKSCMDAQTLEFVMWAANGVVELKQ